MKRIRVIIADDEPLAREGMAAMLAHDPEFELLATCADGAATILAIRHHKPEVVFLDVQMPKKDGFEVLAELATEERPVVVFVTAFDQHAVKAFDVAAMDYLLKPFSDARFAAALTRVKAEVRRSRCGRVDERVEQLLAYVRQLTGEGETPSPTLPDKGARPSSAPRPEYAERIVLKTGQDLHFIKTRDVIWIEAQGDFVRVHLAGQAQLVRETLQAIERKLDGGKFVRIHRSFLVNLEHVRKVTPALYGDHLVLVSDGTKLRLSRNYRSKFKQLISAAGEV